MTYRDGVVREGLSGFSATLSFDTASVRAKTDASNETQLIHPSDFLEFVRVDTRRRKNLERSTAIFLSTNARRNGHAAEIMSCHHCKAV